jgi:hypothetical protein
MRVITVPPSLDYRTFDQLVSALDLGGSPTEPRVLFDARRIRWVDPVGMIGLLAVGTVVAKETGHAPTLHLPTEGNVVGYLGRMGFAEAARPVFDGELRLPGRSGGASDVLLEITTISENRDVHDVVDRVQDRAGTILSRTLHYPPTAVVQFSVILSEVCQNVLEHAGAPGWVCGQTYKWEKRLGGRQVLIIGVGDVGMGFRASLAEEYAGRFGDRWGDMTALEAAFLQGYTRFVDQGRGHGIQQIRKQVRKWDGMIAVRSGTARIADVPSWEDLPALADDIPDFPGAQITIILPAADPV